MLSYNVPPTQNTALVLEFRCLYTHDILKKQKKWHDGSLRFHTFNRRVMVYDDVKNYIGDLHYRQDEEFAEGLELQLDRPVKVEVGEPIGQSSTDLRPILNRGREERDSQDRGQAPKHTIQRATFVNSSGKLKSLSEVLGPSQGRLGRARIQVQSPYEQRSALMQVRQEQPHAKKPKLAAGKENEVSSSRGQKRSENVQGLSRSSLTRPRPSSNSVLFEQRRSGLSSTVVEVSSGDEVNVAQEAHLSAGKVSKSQNSRVLGQAAVIPTDSTSKSTARKISSRTIVGQRTSGQDDRTSLKASKGSNVPHPGVMSGRTDSRSNPILQSEVTILRFQCQPRRKKLMYKALLPFHSTSASLSSGNPDNSATSLSNKYAEQTIGQNSLSRIRQKVPSSGNAIRVEPGPDTGSTLKPHSQRIDPLESKEACDGEGTDQRPQSPLFFSQDSSQTSLPSTHQFDDDDALGLFQSQQHDSAQRTNVGVGVFAQCSNHIAGETLPIGKSDLDTTVPLPEAHPSDSAESNAQGSYADDTSAFTLLDVEKSPFSDNRNNSPPGTFLEVYSSQRTTSDGVSIFGNSQSMPSSPERPRVQASNIGNDTSAPRSDSQSDKQPISGINETNERAHPDLDPVMPDPAAASPDNPSPVTPRQQPQQEQLDCGAWSKLEAFLLFEKWPAVKAKDRPVFNTDDRAAQGVSATHKVDNAYEGIEDHIVLSIDTGTVTNAATRAGPRLNAMSKKRPSILPGIRTARSVLRRDR